MDMFNDRALKVLLDNTSTPCVSVFAPTHPGGAEADPVRWKNLLRQADSQLAQRGLRPDEIRDLLRPSTMVLHGDEFWKSQSNGLAWFLAPGLTKSYRLPIAFRESVVTADRFHVKPMIPLVGGKAYFLLAISQTKVRLFEGSLFALAQVDLKSMPGSMAEFLGFETEKEELGVHAPLVTGKRGGWSAIDSHGQGVDIEDKKDDLLRYFQAVNRALKDYLHGQDAPLVLASVSYLWPIYRQANTYSHLLREGVSGSPDRLSAQQLHAKAWPMVQPIMEAKQYSSAELYQQLVGTGRTCHDLKEVAGAACRGELETLWVAGDCERWGRWESATGAISLHAEPATGDEDLLNFAAWHALRHGGSVIVLPGGDVPGGDVAAGIFWLPSRR